MRDLTIVAKKLGLYLAPLGLFFCVGEQHTLRTPSQEVSVVVESKNCDFSQYKPVRLSGFIPGAIVTKVMPEYPREAINQNLQGEVRVQILVKEDGRVEKVCSTVGGLLGRAAESAALKWTFRKNFGFGTPHYGPYLTDALTFTFSLRDGKPAISIRF